MRRNNSGLMCVSISKVVEKIFIAVLCERVYEIKKTKLSKNKRYDFTYCKYF